MWVIPITIIMVFKKDAAQGIVIQKWYLACTSLQSYHLVRFVKTNEMLGVEFTGHNHCYQFVHITFFNNSENFLTIRNEKLLF